MVGVLWDVKTLRSCISKTIYPIAMKFTEANLMSGREPKY